LARQGYPATPAAGNRATGRPIGSPGPSAGAGGTGRHGFLAAGPDSCYSAPAPRRGAPRRTGARRMPPSIAIERWQPILLHNPMGRAAASRWPSSASRLRIQAGSLRAKRWDEACGHTRLAGRVAAVWGPIL